MTIWNKLVEWWILYLFTFGDAGCDSDTILTCNTSVASRLNLIVYWWRGLICRCDRQIKPHYCRSRWLSLDANVPLRHVHTKQRQRQRQPATPTVKRFMIDTCRLRQRSYLNTRFATPCDTCCNVIVNIEWCSYSSDRVRIVEEVRSLKIDFRFIFEHENVLQKYIWLLNVCDINNYEFCP